MSTSIPSKGDIIINPSTQRPVKVGSRTWLNLVKKGLVEGRYTDPKEVGQLPEQYEEVPPQEINEQIQRVNKTLPRGQQAVRGRGRYKGKIVTRNKRLEPEEVSRYTAQVATRAVANNIDALAGCEDGDDIEAMLQKMILEEMVGSKKTSAPRGRPKQQQQQPQEQYEEEYPDQYDEEEEDDDDGDNWY
jgi:hypothetical protein